MATIEILAGNFGKGTGSISFGQLKIPKQLGGREIVIKAGELEQVEKASEQSIKKFVGTAGWGVVGGALLGPAGLLAGLLLGGKSKKISFVAHLKDGRSFLGTVDNKAYAQILALVDYKRAISPKSNASKGEDSLTTQIDPSDPVTNIESALANAAWKFRREPKSVGQRYTILLAKNDTIQAVIVCSQDSLTEYSYNMMKNAILKFEGDPVLVFVGNSVGSDVEKIAKKEKTTVTKYITFSTSMLKSSPSGFDF